eukprot:XP_011666563.1 PREDICTED: uncharacterized protein LOC105439363 [Strongylocentrotus purpuratus]
MAKAIEHGLKKINEIYDQGDLLCELNRTNILTRQTDDGGQAYGKINVVKGTQWDPIKISKDVLLEKCKLLGSDQIVGVVSGKRLSVYDTHGHHVQLIDVQKKGKVKTVENINALAVITDKILVAESQRYDNLIHVVEYPTGEAIMSLSIDQNVTGMIPIRTGLVLVRSKEKIQAVDYAHYPRVDITEVISYGRTLVNMCVKGGNDELYVMFVKGITPKILEIHVLGDKYQELHKTKITHTTSILSLRAVYTSQGPGFLVIQMGSTISTFKCSFGLRQKGPPKKSHLVPPPKKKYYDKRQFQPSPTPKPDTGIENSSQDEEDTDEEDSVANMKSFIVASEDIKKSEKEKRGQQETNQMHKMPDVQHDKPVFEYSDIDEEGGEIINKEYGISLLIQPGAIEKGQRKIIGVGLSRETHTSGASAGGVSISPVICSEPSGLELEKPARIILQHCLSSWSDDTHVNVHELVDDAQRRDRGVNDKGAKCSIGKNGEVTLDVTRLGRYALTVMGSDVNKKLVCRPFIPKRMPSTKKPIINILIYDFTDGMKKMIMEELENESLNPVIPAHRGTNFVFNLNGQDSPEILLNCNAFGSREMIMEELENESLNPVIPAHRGTNFVFNLNGQDSPEILLTCNALGSREVKSLSTCELIEFTSNSVDFHVDCSDGRAQDITIELSFGNKKIDMIFHMDIPCDGT